MKKVSTVRVGMASDCLYKILLGAWKFSLFQDLADDLYGFLEGLNFPRLYALFHFKIESGGDSADLLVAILR